MLNEIQTTIITRQKYWLQLPIEEHVYETEEAAHTFNNDDNVHTHIFVLTKSGDQTNSCGRNKRQIKTTSIQSKNYVNTNFPQKFRNGLACVAKIVRYWIWSQPMILICKLSFFFLKIFWDLPYIYYRCNFLMMKQWISDRSMLELKCFILTVDLFFFLLLFLKHRFDLYLSLCCLFISWLIYFIESDTFDIIIKVNPIAISVDRIRALWVYKNAFEKIKERERGGSDSYLLKANSKLFSSVCQIQIYGV